jgi:hypothetical protein
MPTSAFISRKRKTIVSETQSNPSESSQIRRTPSEWSGAHRSQGGWVVKNTKGLSTKAINCVLLLVPVTEAIKSHSQDSSRSTMSSSPTIRLLSQEAIEGHVPFRWLFCDHHVSPLEFQSFSNSSSSQDQPSQCKTKSKDLDYFLPPKPCSMSLDSVRSVPA